MAVLGQKGDLAIAQVAFFSLAFLASTALILKHGSGRQSGWIFITILSVLRLIGGGCTLYVATHADASAAAIECAAVTGSVGTAPLLMLLLGVEARIHAGMVARAVSKGVFLLLTGVVGVALVLAIVGGVKGSEEPGSGVGGDCLKASSVVLLVCFVVAGSIAIYSAAELRWVGVDDRRLVWAGVFCVPFLLVRMVLFVCVGFSRPGGTFYFQDVNIWVEAFMVFLMEAVVVVIFTVAGLLSPKAEARTWMEDGAGSGGPSFRQDRGAHGEAGLESQRQKQQDRYIRRGPAQGRRSGRDLNDYRPSRMIMNLIRGH